MIYEEQRYNEDNFVSHFQDLETGYNLVYTHRRLGNSLEIMKRAFKEIQNVYGYKPKFIYLDGERTLRKKFKALTSELGIRQRRSAPEAHQQPKIERSGRLLTIKARALIIGANMPSDLWPEAYLTACYIANRTPTKRHAWKTPFELFIKSIPSIAYLHPFGCRAYPLIYNISRLQKMSPRAQIGYLIGYDSTNIYRIWIPTSNKVIRIRDVKFNDALFYDPSDLVLSALRTIEAKVVMDILEISDESEEQE